MAVFASYRHSGSKSAVQAYPKDTISCQSYNYKKKQKSKISRDNGRQIYVTVCENFSG